MNDSLENFTPLGWSGFGHFHWYTEEDPKGTLACPECNPEPGE